MSNFGKVSIGSNTGNVVLGDGNIVNLAPSLAALGLSAEESARIDAALRALREGRADASDDAQALQRAAGEPDERTRADKIKGWLLRIAPHAAQLAGTIVNPVVGELAKAATAWVAGALGNEPRR